jgi:hypothetical protein
MARVPRSGGDTSSGVLATLDVPGGGDGQTWTTATAKVEAPEKGVHAVWLRFWSKEPEDLAEVDRFEFR